MSNEDVE